MRTITLDEFHAELKAQGVNGIESCAFICPVCKTIQSGADLIIAGAGKTFDEVEKFLAFSCVGRFTRAGPYKPGMPPGRGCNWTLGGLFQCHTLEVITPDGTKHPRFELATHEEAKAHVARTVTLSSMAQVIGT